MQTILKMREGRGGELDSLSVQRGRSMCCTVHGTASCSKGVCWFSVRIMEWWSQLIFHVLGGYSTREVILPDCPELCASTRPIFTLQYSSRFVEREYWLRILQELVPSTKKSKDTLEPSCLEKQTGPRQLQMSKRIIVFPSFPEDGCL